MKQLLFILSTLLFVTQTEAQKLIAGKKTETTVKNYAAGLKQTDTLTDLVILSKKDTLYNFHSIRSRLVARKDGKAFVIHEVYAIPVHNSNDYVLMPLREFSVNPSTGKLTENKAFLKTQVNSRKEDNAAIRDEYEKLREDLKKEMHIDEYDEPLVHRMAVLVWDMTLSAISGNEEFYSILTNLGTEMPAAVAGESGYVWKDCQYLLRSEKIDGFTE